MCEEASLHTVPGAAFRVKTSRWHCRTMLTYKYNERMDYSNNFSSQRNSNSIKINSDRTCAGTFPLFLITNGRVCPRPTNKRLNCSTRWPRLVFWTGLRTVMQGKLPSPIRSNTRALGLWAGGWLWYKTKRVKLQQTLNNHLNSSTCTESSYLTVPFRTASNTAWYVCIVKGEKVTVAKA